MKTKPGTDTEALLYSIASGVACGISFTAGILSGIACGIEKGLADKEGLRSPTGGSSKRKPKTVGECDEGSLDSEEERIPDHKGDQGISDCLSETEPRIRMYVGYEGASDSIKNRTDRIVEFSSDDAGRRTVIFHQKRRDKNFPAEVLDGEELHKVFRFDFLTGGENLASTVSAYSEDKIDLVIPRFKLSGNYRRKTRPDFAVIMVCIDGFPGKKIISHQSVLEQNADAVSALFGAWARTVDQGPAPTEGSDEYSARCSDISDIEAEIEQLIVGIAQTMVSTEGL